MATDIPDPTPLDLAIWDLFLATQFIDDPSLAPVVRKIKTAAKRLFPSRERQLSYLAHREERRAQARAYYHNCNREERAARDHAYYLTYREKKLNTARNTRRERYARFGKPVWTAERARQSHASYLAHCEEHKAKGRARYLAHREKNLTQMRAWYVEHREEHKAKVRAYRLAHREEIEAKRRVYYLAHREEIEAKRHAQYIARKPTPIGGDSD
jgi:hypothetical protein